MNDTSPEIERLYRQMLMEKTLEERFLMGLSMCEAARATVMASLSPDLTPIERKIAVLHRYYGSDFSQEELAKIEQSLRI